MICIPNQWTSAETELANDGTKIVSGKYIIHPPIQTKPDNYTFYFLQRLDKTCTFAFENNIGFSFTPSARAVRMTVKGSFSWPVVLMGTEHAPVEWIAVSEGISIQQEVSSITKMQLWGYFLHLWRLWRWVMKPAILGIQSAGALWQTVVLCQRQSPFHFIN